ncbi:MAG: heme biosynthesis HemY N-terminal domain-containing protein [Pseudomonadota bacterium]
MSLRWLVLLLLALVLGAAAAVWLRADPGYVLLRWSGWVLESSLFGFFAALFGGVLILQLTLRLFLTGVRLPSMLRERMQRRRSERARESFEAGLHHLLEGRWSRAEIELVRRAADHSQGALNYLLAARAAQRQSAGDRRDHYLKMATQNAPAAVATSLARIEFHLERDELLPARSLLRALHERDPEHAYALELLAETLARTEDWDALRALLALPAAARALSETRHRELSVAACAGLMQAAARDARLDTLKTLWESAGAQRAAPALRRTYVRGLVALNASAEAAAQIAQGLREGWDGELALLHGELVAADATTHLAAAEHWLAEFGEKPELLWIAGKACVSSRLWGKARSYLDVLLRLQPTPAVYRELARLAEATQNPDEAARFYKQGLELAATQKQ